jgi:hypothetical protein
MKAGETKITKQNYYMAANVTRIFQGGTDLEEELGSK